MLNSEILYPAFARLWAFDVRSIVGWHRPDWREIHELLTAEAAD